MSTDQNKTSMRRLSSLKPGESGIIASIETPEDIQFKLMEMGIGPGEHIKFIRSAPLGDPLEFELMNYRIAIRKSEADKVVLQ